LWVFAGVLRIFAGCLAASKIATYMRGRREENIMKHSKLSNFHGFWAFQFLMTIPKKLGGFNHN
jgi:hypothetical protein